MLVILSLPGLAHAGEPPLDLDYRLQPIEESSIDLRIHPPVDVDGDGLVDLVYGMNWRTEELWWKAATPSGSYAVAQPLLAGIGIDAGAHLFADVDADGDRDLVLVSPDLGALVVVDNDGGLLRPGPARPLGADVPDGRIRLLSALHLDDDGVVDLLVNNERVARGPDYATWEPVALPYVYYSSFTLVDIDGDGRSDLNHCNVVTFLGSYVSATTRLSNVPAPGAPSPDPWTVREGCSGTLADLGGTGLLSHLEVHTDDEWTGPFELMVSEHTSPGRFRNDVAYPITGPITHAADLDGDGDDDLIAQAVGLPAIHTVYQNVDGVFLEQGTLGIVVLDALDINDDGVAELIVSDGKAPPQLAMLGVEGPGLPEPTTTPPAPRPDEPGDRGCSVGPAFAWPGWCLVSLGLLRRRRRA